MRVVVGISIKNQYSMPLVLMGQRKLDDEASPGFWEFPGGKVEDNETDEEALKREFMEELGVSVAVKKHFCSKQWQYPKRLVQLEFYFVELLSEAWILNAHESLKWLSLEELRSLDMLPANKELLPDLNRELRD